MGEATSSDTIDRQLAEAERKRRFAEERRNEVPTLMEKLKVMQEELDATREVLEKATLLVDGLVSRSKEVHEQETILYRKLQEALPKVLAEVKAE